MRGFFTSFRMTAFVVVKGKLAMFHVEHFDEKEHKLFIINRIFPVRHQNELMFHVEHPAISPQTL